MITTEYFDEWGSKMKTFLKRFFLIVLIVILAAAGYVGYVIVSYDRIPDMQVEAIEEPANRALTKDALKVGNSYTAMTYNIGFGAYLPEYSFFMDGGESSWAESEESVYYALDGVVSITEEIDPDFALYQEVDINGTRSYHVNQYEYLREKQGFYYTTRAVNYDSAFLPYPILEPHGKNKACLALFSKYPMVSSLRRSLPISETVSKIVDLDRCFSVTRIPVDTGKELIIVNVHASAYGSSDAVREGQIGMLCDVMREEYEKGNYVIVGGDFNHDLKADENMNAEDVASWAYPFPRSSLPEHFAFAVDGYDREEFLAMHDSARNADIPYVEGVTYTITLDSFIISDNIVCEEYGTVDTGYAYSDHEAVFMQFSLVE